MQVHLRPGSVVQALLALADVSLLALGVGAPLLAQSAGGTASGAAYSDGLRRWTPEDSVRVRYLYNAANASNDVNQWARASAGRRAEQLVGVSPGGDYFFIGSHVGELGCNCNRYTVSVFSSAQVNGALSQGRRDVAPLRQIRGTAIGRAIAFEPIRAMVWEDGSTLRFVAEDEQGAGLYRLNVATGERRTLIHLPPNIEYPSFSLHGDTVLAQGGISRGAVPLSRDYPVEWPLATDNTYEWSQSARVGGTTGHFAAIDGVTRLLLETGPFSQPLIYSPLSTPQLSPDRRWAVFAMPVFSWASHQPGFMPEMPAGWRRYEGLDPTVRALEADDYRRLFRYVLVSLAGEAEPRVLIDAPQGPVATSPQQGVPAVQWSPDGRRIVIANAGLPLNEDAMVRRTAGYLIDYDVASGRANVIEPMRGASTDGQGGRIRSLSWQGEELVVRYSAARGQPSPSRIYGRTTNGWQGREGVREAVAAATATSAPAPATPSNLAGGLTLELRESMNDPPQLIAKLGGRELSLLGPDPVLQGLWRATERTVTWAEPGGGTGRGQLLMPRDARGPVPLVVHLQGVEPGRFRPDDVARGGPSAQALVARGMAVLRFDPNLGDGDRRALEVIIAERRAALDRGGVRPAAEREMVGARDQIEAAVASLAAEGLIDPARVGLLGFSRHGLRTHYIITHPNQLVPAAAVINDSVTHSYGRYFAAEANSTTRRSTATALLDPEWTYGGTMTDNPQGWLEHAPLFNVHRAETPALFTVYTDGTTPSSVPEYMEVIAAYRRANREFDMRMVTDGGHNLQRPQARAASMSLNVDWMDFWLQGREHPDPARAGQYLYWRSLREHRDARRAAAAGQPLAPAQQAPARPNGAEP